MQKTFKINFLILAIIVPIMLSNNAPAIPNNGTIPHVDIIIRFPYMVNQTQTLIKIKQLEYLFISDAEQQRNELIPDEILMKVALEKALDMANRNYYGHVSPDGIGANTLVINAGYNLPDYYDHRLSGNNIESLMDSTNDAAYVWQVWKDSPGHRMHVLGEHEEFKKQTHYGIGYAENLNSTYQHFWVLITCPPQ